MSQLLVTVITDVERGVSLAKALGAYARSLSPLIITVIALGERSGTLAHNLLYGASELQKRHEVRKKIIGALIYPVIVVSASLSIAVFLLLVIFPKITPIFIDLGADLPLSTRVLLGFSDWLGAYGWWLVAGTVTLSVALITTRHTPRMQIIYAWLQLRLPLFGRLLQAYHLMTICRTLGMLGRSHIPVVTALTITAESMPQVLYKHALQELAASVASGQGLAKQLALRPDLFPPTVCQLIEVGETTGKLAETCLFVSELYDSDIRDQIKNLTTILEPVLMLGMGLLIGFIAVSIITPIYGITQLLN